MVFNQLIGILTFLTLLPEFLLASETTRSIVPAMSPGISSISVLPSAESLLRSHNHPSNTVIRHSVRAPKLPHEAKQVEKYQVQATLPHYYNLALQRRPSPYTTEYTPLKSDYLRQLKNASKCFRLNGGTHPEYSESSTTIKRLCELKIASNPTRRVHRDLQRPSTSIRPNANKYFRNLKYSINPTFNDNYGENQHFLVENLSIKQNKKYQTKDQSGQSSPSRLLLAAHKTKKVRPENYHNHHTVFKNVASSPETLHFKDSIRSTQSHLQSGRPRDDPQPSITDFEMTYSPSFEINVLPKSKQPTNLHIQQSGNFAEPPAEHFVAYSTAYLSENQPATPGTAELPRHYQRNYLFPLSQSSAGHTTTTTTTHLTYPEVISRDNSSSYSWGPFPLDPYHKQPSYKYAKSSYEVPLYEEVPPSNKASSNNVKDNYPPFSYEPSSAVEKSYQHIEPYEIFSNFDETTTTFRPCYSVKTEETENDKPKRNQMHVPATDGLNIGRLNHILDVPELRQAFEASQSKKVVSLSLNAKTHEPTALLVDKS